MNEIFQALILGIVQGLTELLPISSSAHLNLFPWIFGWNEISPSFDVALHIGTLFAIVLFFFKDWVNLIKGGYNQVIKKKKAMRCVPHCFFLFFIFSAASFCRGLLGCRAACRLASRAAAGNRRVRGVQRTVGIRTPVVGRGVADAHPPQADLLAHVAFGNHRHGGGRGFLRADLHCLPQLPPGAQERVYLFAQPLEAERFRLFEQQCSGGGAGFERQLVRSVGHGAAGIFLSIRLQGAGKTACDE